MGQKRETIRCPNDNSRIPLAGQSGRWPRPTVRFYWCSSCGELFAFTGEGELGGRFAASYSYDDDKKAFVRWKASGNATDVEMAQAALANLTFLPGDHSED